MSDSMTRADRPTVRRVLVVEDHRANRTMLRVALEMRGFEVEEASDGREAVNKALSWRPDAAVVDIGLPGQNGHEVARQVRSALGDRIRLVAFTAYGQPEDEVRSLEAEFDAHLTKPVEADELFRQLQAAWAEER
jgi:CheY-like chemotaxis protein